MRTLFAIRRGRRHSRSWSFLMIAAMMAMLLAPVGDQVALAQVGDQAEEAEQPEQPTPTPEPTAISIPPTSVSPPESGGPADVTVVPPEIPDDPTAVPTVAPTTEPGGAGTYTLTISVFRCDHPAFDPHFSENIQMVFDQCTAPGSGQFSVESTIPVPSQSGSVLEFEIGPGLAVMEQVAPGFDDPLANCFVLDASGTIIDQIGPGEASGGYWKLGSTDNDVHCDWYQFDQGHGDVYIVNMACAGPLGFPAPTYQDLVAMCTAPAGPITFGVQFGQIHSQVDTSSGEFNDVFFDGVSSGPIAIWAEAPAQFESARVFCQVNTVAGVEIEPFAEVPVPDFRATSLTLGHDQRLHCNWFNIPFGPGVALPDDDAGTGTQPPTANTSELRIRLHTCPADYDPEQGGANPNLDCPAGSNGVSFTLADADPATVDLQSMTGDAVDNTATFGELAPGVYTVTESVPDDIDSIFVLGCAGGGIDPIPVFIDDGSTEINLPQGVISTCPWFHVPEEDAEQRNIAEASPQSIAALTGTASLTMYAYSCPAGFDVTTVDANPQASCTLTDGVEFELDDSIDDGAGRIFTTGGTGTGYSTIDGLAADTYAIDQYVRNGTTATFAWDCYDLAGSSTRTDPLATGDHLVYELAEGAQVRCDWFSVTGGTGRVIINSHACGYLVPAYILSNPTTLATRCTDDPGTIEFTVVSGAHQETQPASKSPLRLASFANVPSGYTAVVSQLVDGWATPIVFCQVLLENGTQVSPPTQMEALLGHQVNFPLEPGQVVSCDWYNVAQGFVNIHITNHACPPGFEVYGANPSDLESACVVDPGPVDFTVRDGGLYLETKTASSGTPVDFLSVPSGDLRISEKLPDGYGLPFVLCSIGFEDGSTVSEYFPRPVVNGPSVDMALSAGQILSCDWYNAPGGLGSVHVWTQACPPGLDVHALTNHELELYCAEDIGTVEFTITDEIELFQQTASSTNLFRYAEFPAVPAGAVTIRETLPTGYGPPIVFCHTQSPSVPVGPDRKMTIDGESSITWELEANHDLYCRWYNVLYEETTGDNGRIVNYKRFCPETVDLSSPTLETLEQACPEIRGGIAFTVSNQDGFSRAAVTSGQTGVAIIENVPPSEVTIRETIPDGFGEPIVFCDSLPKDQRAFASIPMARIPVIDGTLQYTVEIQAEVHCHWFNIVDTSSSVTVIKHECPDGTTYEHDLAWYQTNCTAPHAGVEFKLTHGEGDVPGTTNASGEVAWSDVPLGPFSIQEYIPPAYGEPVVFCFKGTDLSLAPAVRMEAPGGYLEAELTVPGTYYTCHWFNIHGGPGDVTVHKWTCPPGYDLDAEGANPREDCTEATNGVNFTLADGNPATADLQTTTGDSVDGAVYFGGLAPGPYTITETVPSGTQAVFVLDCHGQRMGELRPSPLSTGDTLEIDVGAGEKIECHWYNVPEYEQGRLTVVKYQCWTTTFVSAVDCEIFEGGQEFDLVSWNGEEWEYHASGTTDGVGQYTWVDLTPGEYWLDEHERDWCHLASDQISDDGNWLNVHDQQETVVEVYNCSGDPADQGKPGKTPTKYPDTGVPPVSGPGRETP